MIDLVLNMVLKHLPFNVLVSIKANTTSYEGALRTFLQCTGVDLLLIQIWCFVTLLPYVGSLLWMPDIRNVLLMFCYTIFCTVIVLLQ